MDYKRLTKQLQFEEGEKLKLYKCPADKFSIGIGRNLEDRGISQDEALYLLSNDITRCEDELRRNLPFFEKLSDNRQEALLNMCFNLGISGLLKFKNMLRNIEEQNWIYAIDELEDSKYAKQVPNRVARLKQQILKG